MHAPIIYNLKDVDIEFYSNTYGEVNDGTDNNRHNNLYPVIPPELKEYMQKIWQPYPDCYLYMVRIKDELGVLIVTEFEADQFSEMMESAMHLSHIQALIHDGIYYGKNTGLKLLFDNEPKHELGLFLHMDTNPDRVTQIVWHLRNERNLNTEDLRKFLSKYQKQPSEKEFIVLLEQTLGISRIIRANSPEEAETIAIEAHRAGEFSFTLNDTAGEIHCAVVVETPHGQRDVIDWHEI